MLKAADKKKIATLLHLDEAALESALTATEEVDIAIPEVQVFTAEQLTTRDKNTKREGYDDGVDAGEEMAVKRIRQANNLDFKGKKIENLVEHLKAATTPIEESEVVKNLQKSVKNAEKERDQAKELLNRTQLQGKLHAKVTGIKDEFSASDVLSLMGANGYEFKEENGTLNAYKDGSLLRDEKLQSALPAEDVIKTFVTTKNMLKEATPADATRQGRGGDSSIGTGMRPKFNTKSEVERAWIAEHGAGSMNGQAYATHLESVMKENPNLDFKA